MIFDKYTINETATDEEIIEFAERLFGFPGYPIAYIKMDGVRGEFDTAEVNFMVKPIVVRRYSRTKEMINKIIK